MDLENIAFHKGLKFPINYNQCTQWMQMKKV